MLLKRVSKTLQTPTYLILPAIIQASALLSAFGVHRSWAACPESHCRRWRNSSSLAGFPCFDHSGPTSQDKRVTHDSPSAVDSHMCLILSTAVYGRRGWWWATILVVFSAQMVKNLSAIQETLVQSLGQEDPLEKEMATHSSILVWRIPWTEEPGGYSLWGHKELERTKWLTLFLSFQWITGFHVSMPFCSSLTLNLGWPMTQLSQ